MNAPVKIADARPLLPVVDILKILAESSAASWALFPLDLADVVDPLQDFAERTRLVHAIGQDAIQQILSEAFAPYRELAELVEPEEIPLVPDPEPPPRAYRTPRATIDAFLYVARLGDADYLTEWLERHPLDVPELRKVWKQKCTAQ